MATTDARPGFKLPWSAERSDTGNPAEPPNDPTPSDPVADAAPRADTAPAQEIETTDMIDAAPASSDHVAAVDAEVLTQTPDTEPSSPRLASTAAPVAQAAAPGRRPNKFLADLSKAMQVAAETARSETLARFSSEAKTHIESIHATSATEATELRKRADDDIVAIRDWSKAEIARIREETDQRINERKGGLEHEVEEHAAAIELRIEQVQARVAAFEAEMATFFERLLAEDDPTRFAAMAESLPEPPSFDSDATEMILSAVAPHVPTVLIDDLVEADASRVEAIETVEVETVEVQAVEAEAVEAEVEAEMVQADAPLDAADAATPTEDTAPSAGDLFSIGVDDVPAMEATGPSAGDPRLAALGLTPDFAAAEAEAAAFSADDAGVDDEIPTIGDDALAARLAGLVPDTSDADNATTRVVVEGLVSVASIAGFKRHLSRSNGVQSVGVSSGPDGEFIFAVVHTADVQMKDVIPSLPGFAARVTGESDGDLMVTARDPETEN